jgi:hypothetical protein
VVRYRNIADLNCQRHFNDRPLLPTFRFVRFAFVVILLFITVAWLYVVGFTFFCFRLFIVIAFVTLVAATIDCFR